MEICSKNKCTYKVGMNLLCAEQSTEFCLRIDCSAVEEVGQGKLINAQQATRCFVSP